MQQGKLAEMRTGEGKTLTAVFPVYLNALSGKGVHVLTFNDYLARRDAKWMGPVYEFLGLSVGFVQEGMDIEERQEGYNSDVTYLTAKEDVEHPAPISPNSKERKAIDPQRECIYCGLCEEACPEEAIVMSRDVELAAYERAPLLLHKKDLLRTEESLGRRLDFIRAGYDR